MGKGQRHSKNAGVMGSESLSYAERKGLGFGTVQERLGKDSMGNYYDCCLTLQRAVDPVATPCGYIYSKEAILENLLAQKKAIKRKVAAYEAQQEDLKLKAAEKETLENQAKLISFDRQNHMGISTRTAEAIENAIHDEAEHLHDAKGARTVLATKGQAERVKEMKAFWIPSQSRNAAILLEKPSTDLVCPASGKKLRLKDLITMKFTEVPGEEHLYMDPITKDVFTNASKLVLLKATGDVILKETYEKCVKPEGSYAGARIKPDEVIELATGGTGFVAHDGDKVMSKKHFMLGPGSGLADLRGQHKGARSLGGLSFNN